ncbi:hypothetical protein HDE_03335 [Halotydeus destructor]|nr:hypothetical protein HDE_03335 [Halotydeus destructor]
MYAVAVEKKKRRKVAGWTSYDYTVKQNKKRTAERRRLKRLEEEKNPLPSPPELESSLSTAMANEEKLAKAKKQVEVAERNLKRAKQRLELSLKAILETTMETETKIQLESTLKTSGTECMSQEY